MCMWPSVQLQEQCWCAWPYMENLYWGHTEDYNWVSVSEPLTVGGGAMSIGDSILWIWLMQYNAHMKIIPITWVHAKEFQTCTWWHVVRWQKRCINGPEKISNMQRTNPKNYKRDQEGGAESYADMTIYAIDPAGTVSTMCSHKLPTTIVTFLILSNLWYLIASLWLKCMPCRTLLIFVALLTLRVRARPRGLLVRFNAGLLWLSN